MHPEQFFGPPWIFLGRRPIKALRWYDTVTYFEVTCSKVKDQRSGLVQSLSDAERRRRRARSVVIETDCRVGRVTRAVCSPSDHQRPGYDVTTVCDVTTDVSQQWRLQAGGLAARQLRAFRRYVGCGVRGWSFQCYVGGTGVLLVETLRSG